MYKTQQRIMKLARKHELNLQNFQLMIKAAKKRIAKLERLQDATLQHEIDTLQDEIAQLEADQAALNEEFRQLHSAADEGRWLSPKKLGQIEEEFVKVSGTRTSST